MWKFVGVLLVAGLAIKYWWLVLLIVAVLLVVKYAPVMVARADADSKAQQAHLAAIAARADEQHHQVLNGDERGLYGMYTPAC